MRFQIHTKVKSSPTEVFEGFTKQLFLDLKPPLTPLKLKRFDGCKEGDEVQLNVFFMDWHSKITEVEIGKDEIYFIDEGSLLPFTFTFWRHRHRMLAIQGGGCEIIDDIEYHSPLFLGPLLYPMLYLQFWYRKRVYKKYFD